jgi:two-component system sensor histidine kinase CpxA
MKSLFLRLLLFMWLSMAVVGAAFAWIHAWAFPQDASAVRRRFTLRSTEVRGEHALLCSRSGLPRCERGLEPVDPRDASVALYRNGQRVLGTAVVRGPDLAREALRAPEGTAFATAERELTAVVLPRDRRYVAVASAPVRSPWLFFLVPETLPYRLLAIVAVTGVAAAVLARYLSRPVALLRRATQAMAAGDLSVRTSGELGSADRETQALGRDLDRMAERIELLLESERRLRRDISHELRSPLSRLNIALELVRRKSPPDALPAFDRIERETERLNAMIGELLTLNRLESERTIRRDEIDLEQLTSEVVADARLEAEPRGARVTLEAVGPTTVLGDAELLRRAFENVLRNAVRFSEPESSVDVTLVGSDEGVEIRVRDHGPGVPEAALEHIWKPFYRVESDHSRTAGGTGIGLDITERAVTLHGGGVSARNAADGGLVVSLVLPRTEPDSTAAAVA